MSYYEYRVVPAPKSLPKVKGQKSPEGRYAHAVAEALNAEGRDGWEFQRSETIEAPVKRGFLSKARAETLSVLVFRRWVEIEPAPQEYHATAPEPADHQMAASDLQMHRIADPEEPDAPRADPEPALESARAGGLVARRDDTRPASVPPLRGPGRD